MTTTLDPLWRLLRDHPDPRHTEAAWRRELGPGFDVVAVWLKVTRQRAGTWPCGLPGTLGCERRIVEHSSGELVAVCDERPPRCAKVSVDRADLGLRRLDLDRFARAFARSSGLGELPVEAMRGANARVTIMGPAALGALTVIFVITTAGSTLALLDVAEVVRQDHPLAMLVLLAPVVRRPPSGERRAFERMNAEVLPLSQAVKVVGGQLAGDLFGWVLEHRDRLDGLDPTPLLGDRYDLVLDPRRGRCWLWGTGVDLRRSLRLRLFLEGLAKCAGKLVTKDELFDEVWPDRSPSEIQGWEGALRTTKSRLDKKLALALEGRDSPIETVEGGPVDGGYRLALDPDRLLWWSEPPA